MNAIFQRSDLRTRRHFLANVARGCLGVGTLPWLAPWVRGDSPITTSNTAFVPTGATAKHVIYLFMEGGMSHIDSFDTKPGREVQGPVESLPTTADGVQVSQYFPQMARQMHHVAVFNSLNSNQGAHAQGRYYMHTSYFLRGTIQHPDMGAWSSYFLDQQQPNLPANVKIGGNSNGLGGGFLESKYAAVPIGDPAAGLQHSALPNGTSDSTFDRRLARAKQLNQQFLSRYDHKQVRAYTDLYDEAVRLMRSEDLQAFDISSESAEVRGAYGESEFGQGCLLARRLVEHGVRFVEVNLGGWDTHTDNFERLTELGPQLDQGMAALIADLSERGLLGETMVVLATEFGRTPKIVADRNGRNHYPKAFSCLMAGGGVRGGQRYGKTDDDGMEVTDDLVTVKDFNATIAHAMGLPLDRKVFSPSRRPFTIADDGQPILKVFS
ncbi:MAG: DUF1501 domain-containing protein [Pirellulaceae bacterium]|nr:DUF1501 domain-containing protein [Planctomycetales bacterium]